MPWAELGGTARSLAWADAALTERGRTVRGHRQIRSWNLSSIWRIDTDEGSAWLKEVPPFAAHEGALLRWLDRPGTTPVLAARGQRMLLADVAGTDRYDAGPAERLSMLTELLRIQADAMSRLPELIALGVPLDDPPGFQAEVATLLPEWLAFLDEDARAGLTELVDGLAARFAAIEACVCRTRWCTVTSIRATSVRRSPPGDHRLGRQPDHSPGARPDADGTGQAAPAIRPR